MIEHYYYDDEYYLLVLYMCLFVLLYIILLSYLYIYISGMYCCMLFVACIMRQLQVRQVGRKLEQELVDVIERMGDLDKYVV